VRWHYSVLLSLNAQCLLTCFLDYSSHLASTMSVRCLKGRRKRQLWPGRCSPPATSLSSISTSNFRIPRCSPLAPFEPISCLRIQADTPPRPCSWPHLFLCPICNSFIRLGQILTYSLFNHPTQLFPHLTGSIIKVFINPLCQKVSQAARPLSPPFLQSALRFVVGGISGGLFLTHQTRSSNRTRFCDTSAPNLHPSHPHKQLRPIGTILKTDSNILVRHT
jgi:hypothetical protein